MDALRRLRHPLGLATRPVDLATRPVIRPLAGALALALAVAACGGGDPSVTPSASATQAPTASASIDPADPNAALYAAIEAQVAELRELEPTRPTDRTVLDEDGLRAHVRELLEEEMGTPEAAAAERLLKALGLLPRDADLRALYEDTLASQVAGQYDPEDRLMYLISSDGEIGPNEQVTYAHEFTHALQDQYFDLATWIGDETDQGDRQAARTALVEGDATLLMTYWARDNLTAEQLLEVVGSVDPESQAILDGMPMVIRESLLFPYDAGLTFVLGLQVQGGWEAVDAAFANPPASTEQILHPEAYGAGELPVSVSFPDDLATRLGAGWSVAAQDTLGEFGLELWLRDLGGAAATVTTAAAAGWGGDRVVLVEGPNGADAAVLETVWDADAEADEFEAAAQATVSALRSDGRSVGLLRPQPDRVVIVIADSDDTLGRVANALGYAG